MIVRRAAWLLFYLLVSAPAWGADVATPSTGATPATPSAKVSGAAPAAVPGAVSADPRQVTLQADDLQLDTKSDTYRASGNVRMVRDGVSLQADQVTYNRNSGDALAQGNILLERSGDTLKGNRLSLNLLSETGEMTPGDLFIKRGNFYVRGEKLEKTGEESYRLEKGSFTTCDGDDPSWHFQARKIDVTLDDFATARDAVFYAGDIPIFYSPFLIFPVKTDRQSGLLMPKPGHSSKKGYYIQIPYYWAVSESQDVTFGLDLESSRGAGLAVDYRYARPKGGEGRFQTFGIYDTQADRPRGEIDQRHLEVVSPNTMFASSIHLITDRSYYLDYGEIAGDYNRQLLESSIFFDHRWERYGVSGEVRYTQDLVASNNDATIQRFPSLSFVAAGEKVGPFFLSMDSSFVNFQRTVGTTGERVVFHPKATWYAKPAGLDLSLYGGYRQRLYNIYGAQADDGFEELGQADAGAVLSLPLERVYGDTYRHVLIPSLEYGWVQRRGDEDLPFFDYEDRVLAQNSVGWSLSNVLTGKSTAADGTPEYRDLASLRLSQLYQISGQFAREVPATGSIPAQSVPRDLLTLVDPGHHLGDLWVEGRVNPVKDVAFGLDTRYNPVDNNFSSFDISMDWKGEGTSQAGISYRASRDQLEYMEGRLSFPLTRQIIASVLGRYSFDRGAFLESRYSLEYKRQCWSVIAAYADRVGSTLVSSNQEFTVNFTLYGVGSPGPIRAF
ncbi:LPS-assembly protein LptD [Geomonas sp. Red276]